MGRPSTKCPHNDALVCDHIKDCNECGWFPGVREKRLERIRKDRQIQRINLYAHVANEEKIGIRRNKIK